MTKPTKLKNSKNNQMEMTDQNENNNRGTESSFEDQTEIHENGKLNRKLRSVKHKQSDEFKLPKEFNPLKKVKLNERNYCELNKDSTKDKEKRTGRNSQLKKQVNGQSNSKQNKSVQSKNSMPIERVTTPVNFSDNEEVEEVEQMDSTENDVELEISFLNKDDLDEFSESGSETEEESENPKRAKKRKSRSMSRSREIPNEDKKAKRGEYRQRSKSRSKSRDQQEFEQRYRSDPFIQELVKKLVSEQVKEKLKDCNKTGKELHKSINVQLSPIAQGRFKSPSDTTLYSPAVNRQYDSTNSQQLNLPSCQIGSPTPQKISNSNKNKFSEQRINDILSNLRLGKNGLTEEKQTTEALRRPSTLNDGNFTNEPREEQANRRRSNNATMNTQMMDARATSEAAVLEAERFQGIDTTRYTV